MRMKSIIFLAWFLFLMNIVLHTNAQGSLRTEFYGINLTGLERTWDSPIFNVRQSKRAIENLKSNDIKAIRLPIAFQYHFSEDRRFLKKLKNFLAHCSKTEINLVIAYFGHDLSEENLNQSTDLIIDHWLRVLEILPPRNSNIFLEIVNEPTISPTSWEKVAVEIISNIRQKNEGVPLIVGATNSNSMFELSRTMPFSFNNIIYTFHFYEPYIFTHQGTEWTGNQHSTKGIPYPFQEGNMPIINPKAIGTSGEINFRDYYLTGNRVALEDKISQISNWAKNYEVELWCTEYGVTINSDVNSRITYLRDLSEVLKNYRIPGFIWEWEGNFGVNELVDIHVKK